MFELKRHNGTGYETISRHHTPKAATRALDAATLSNPPPTPRFDGPYPTYPLEGRYFIAKPTTLITSTERLTNAYWLINWARSRDGVSVTKRQKGFSDYPQLMELVAEGLLETRNNGPRGGQTWHATRRGRRAVAKVDDVKFGKI